MNLIHVHPSGWGFCERGGGRTFTPWGCNYYDPETGWSPRIWEKFDAGRVAEHFGHIRAIGGNVVRVFASVSALLQSPRRVNPAGLAKMEKMLALAEAAGLRVIWSGPGSWEGTPRWWRESTGYEAYIRPDLIAGTSVGAIVGAGVAAGVPAAEMHEYFKAARWRHLATPSWSSRLSLFDTHPLGALLERIVAAQTFDHDLEVELAHAGQHDLAGLGIGLDAERRILEREPIECTDQLRGVFIGLGLDDDVDHRVGNCDRIQKDRRARITQRVAGRDPSTRRKDRADHAALDRANVFATIREHPHEPTDLLELAGAVLVTAPPAELSAGWDEVRRQLRRNRARQKK